MILRRLPPGVVVALFVLSALRAFGAATPHVKASLVAADASVQPGKPIAVALRLLHDPHWHTYWVFPGTGLPTSIKWTLPPGWQASEIQWPAPHILRDRTGNIVGNGYEDDTLLPVTITAPADAPAGSTVTLNAAVNWLECENTCVPGSAKLTLELHIDSPAPQPDAAWGEKIRATRAALPRSDSTWKFSATRDVKTKTVTLAVAPASAAAHTPQDLHFFSQDGLVAFELPQVVKPDGRGGFVLTLPSSPEAPPDAKTLSGVITSENGWAANNPATRGLRVDATLTAAASGTTAAATSAPSATQSSALTAPPPPASASLLVTLAVAFVGGLILNLMPCVFPVIGIKILGFVNQAGHERAKIVTHALTFTIGVLLSFWVLAGVLAVLGGGRGWGYQLQIPGFNFSVAIVMLVFAMCLSGVFEFGLRATSVGGNLQMKSGYAGSFFSGVLATVVATPCSAPFLATALGATITLPALQKFAVFTAIGLGLSTPYLLLSIFPAAVKILPRPGAWMETFKEFMAFPLYATVAYLVWVLAAQVGDEGYRGMLFGLVLVAMGVWFYGRWNAPGASPGRVRFGIAALIACGALGVWIGWPHQASSTEKRDSTSPPQVVWDAWSPEVVAKLRGEGRIIYVDFTARWCATCQTNKKLVFHSDEVLRYFADKKIATLRGDWTNQDARITAELARYQRAAVPFNVIWLPDKNEPITLPEVLTPGIVLDAIKSNDTRVVTGL